MVAHAFNPNSKEAEADKSLGSRSPWSIKQVSGKHSDTLLCAYIHNTYIHVCFKERSLGVYVIKTPYTPVWNCQRILLN